MNLDKEDRKCILYDKLCSDLLIKKAAFHTLENALYSSVRHQLFVEMEEISRQIKSLKVDEKLTKIIRG